MSDSKRDFRTYFNGKVPLDWKSHVPDGGMDAEWKTPVWNVFATYDPTYLIVSFSRCDRKYPSKDDLARFAMRLSDDWEWTQIQDDAVQIQRDGKWSWPNIKFIGHKKKA